MDYSVYQYTAPFNQLLLGLLGAFLTKRLWDLPSTTWIRILAIFLGISTVGCLLHAVTGGLGIMVGQEVAFMPRRWIGLLGIWLSPLANVFTLAALTVLVCHKGSQHERAPAGVLTREQRYGTGRVQNPSAPG